MQPGLKAKLSLYNYELLHQKIKYSSVILIGNSNEKGLIVQHIFLYISLPFVVAQQQHETS